MKYNMKKILLVEDNLDFLKILAKVLSKYYEVIQATKVHEASNILDSACKKRWSHL